MEKEALWAPYTQDAELLLPRSVDAQVPGVFAFGKGFVAKIVQCTWRGFKIRVFFSGWAPQFYFQVGFKHRRTKILFLFVFSCVFRPVILRLFRLGYLWP